METLKIGIIGTGNIFDAYMKGCGVFPILQVVACADMLPERAAEKAAQHNLRALSVDDLLADPDVDLVINLTVPRAHIEVDRAIVAAGKHLYSEKPLGLDLNSARAMLDSAQAAGLRVGCAPDTFLGGGLQTCRKLIDDGWIGRPIAASAFLMSRGPESWHPNPAFFYETGGGPMLDMGPYYLTAMIHLLGPIETVTAATNISFPERVATSTARYGEVIPVEVSTHAAGVLQFASGAVGTLVTSFDVHAHSMPRIEIYGSEGTLSVPDPNTFGGPVQVWTAADRQWREIPLTHHSDVQRGIGVADMAYALHSGRPHRASGELAYHVLEAMLAFDQSSQDGARVALSTQPPQPAALPTGLIRGQLDA